MIPDSSMERIPNQKPHLHSCQAIWRTLMTTRIRLNCFGSTKNKAGKQNIECMTTFPKFDVCLQTM